MKFNFLLVITLVIASSAATLVAASFWGSGTTSSQTGTTSAKSTSASMQSAKKSKSISTSTRSSSSSSIGIDNGNGNGNGGSGSGNDTGDGGGGGGRASGRFLYKYSLRAPFTLTDPQSGTPLTPNYRLLGSAVAKRDALELFPADSKPATRRLAALVCREPLPPATYAWETSIGITWYAPARAAAGSTSGSAQNMPLGGYPDYSFSFWWAADESSSPFTFAGPNTPNAAGKFKGTFNEGNTINLSYDGEDKRGAENAAIARTPGSYEGVKVFFSPVLIASKSSTVPRQALAVTANFTLPGFGYTQELGTCELPNLQSGNLTILRFRLDDDRFSLKVKYSVREEMSCISEKRLFDHPAYLAYPAFYALRENSNSNKPVAAGDRLVVNFMHIYDLTAGYITEIANFKAKANANANANANAGGSAADSLSFRVSLYLPCYAALSKYCNFATTLPACLAPLRQPQPEAGYDISFQGSFSTIPADLKAETIRQLSMLNRTLMTSFFNHAYSEYRKKTTPKDATETLDLLYRPASPVASALGSSSGGGPAAAMGESIYVQFNHTTFVVILATQFSDEADRVFARTFLTELADSRRLGLGGAMNAPTVRYSRDIPAELAAAALPKSKLPPANANYGFVSFYIDSRHLDNEGIRDATFARLLGFRDYFHYHIKCAKAYVHSRMLTQVDNFTRVLSRAKVEAPESMKEKKTISGRTFVRKV